MRSNIWPILRREYLIRIKSKAFWISTAIFPLLVLAFTVLPSLLTARSKASPEPVHIIDAVGDFAPIATDVVEKERRAADPPLEVVSLGGQNIDSVRKDLNARTEAGEIQGYVVVDETAVNDGEVVYYARNTSAILADNWINRIITRSIRLYRLRKLGLEGEQVEAAISPIDFDVRKAADDPRQQTSGIGAFFLSFSLVMFIYFALIFYGLYVLRGVLEEKSNRIVEIIISTVKPFELMMGKILGIGAVGLTQISIWVVSALVLTAPQTAALFSLSGDLPKISTMSMVFFPVYFVLGFLLFATLYAGIGSMFNSEEDAQQFVGIANMLIIIPMVLLMPVMKNPGGAMATGLSLFPFFTPILMFLRIGVQPPPVWQIALSIVIMVATILAMIWLVAKIYRIGILMYGKKPTVPEIIRWLRYT